MRIADDTNASVPGAGLVRRQHVSEGMRDRAREMRRAPTPAEEMLWSALRSGHFGGPRFRRQQVIDGYIADFYCHSAGLVVEVDGGIHEAREARESDAERDAILQARGLTILRVSNEDVLGRLDAVVERIGLACRNHPTPQPPPPPGEGERGQTPLSPWERGRGEVTSPPGEVLTIGGSGESLR